MKKIVYRSRAIQGIILLTGLCLLLSLWPFRFFHEIVTTSVPVEDGVMSQVINDEKTLMQCFVVQYDHMDTLRVFLGEESVGENFYVRILDDQWQMVCEEKVAIDHGNLPGYHDVLIDVEMNVGTVYYCILQGDHSDIYVATEAVTPEENPYGGMLYYDNSEMPGMNLAADYNYIVPLRKEKVFLSGAVILLLLAALIFVAEKLFKKKDKLVTVEQVFKTVASPLVAAGVLVCLVTIFMGMWGPHLLDNSFYVVSVLFLAGILFYAIYHNRDGRPPLLTWAYLKSHAGDLLQSVCIAGAITGCCEYMNGLYDIHHSLAERKEMIWFALALIAMFQWKEIVNLYNLVYLIAAGICGYGYYQTNLTPEMDEPAMQVLRYTIYIAVLLGFILLRTIVALCKKKLARPNIGYSCLLAVFFAAVIIYRNTRWWTVVMAVGFTLFYLTYGMWEHKERLLVNICRGVVMQFIFWTGDALLHRPYLSYTTARYPHNFHTVTIAATYLTMVECVALVLLFAKFAKSKKLRDCFKELVFFGVVSSYILLTMARTAFFALVPPILFAVLLMASGRGREKLKNIGTNVGMMILAVLICFPVTFTVQRTIPVLHSDPYMYDFERDYQEIVRGSRLDSKGYMRVGRFIDLFAEKIFGIPEGTFDIYGEIEAYRQEHGITETSQVQPMPKAVIKGVTEGKLIASADYVPEAEEAVEDDYTNGRLDIFRSYIEQLNMTGHETMGALLEDGSTAVHAHNIYLQAAYDHGIPVGILFLILGIASFVKACLYYVKRKEKIVYAALPAVVIMAVAVAGMVEWIFHISNPCGLMLMLVITPFLFDKGEKNE